MVLFRRYPPPPLPDDHRNNGLRGRNTVSTYLPNTLTQGDFLGFKHLVSDKHIDIQSLLLPDKCH